MSRVLIMAGGTGGHVMPGLAVAEVLISRGAEVSWLGTAAGIEATLVPAANIPLHTIASRGLRGYGWSRLAAAPFMLIRSAWQAWVLLRHLRPAVVLGMGGYAAGPGGVAAWLMRVPLVLHEQNRVMGLTNRLLKPLSRRVLYGFPFYSRDDRSRQSSEAVVGNPVSQALSASPAPATTESTAIRILVLGGSQGARALNQSVAQWSNRWRSGAEQKGNQGYELWHQCGGKLLEETRILYGAEGAENRSSVRLDGFIDDMAAAYRWADLVIARAGALTISELCLARKPSILIPLPSAVGDHQTANAQYLAERKAALLLAQEDLDAESLNSAIDKLSDAGIRQQMMAAAGELARPDAAERVAQACLEWCDA